MNAHEEDSCKFSCIIIGETSLTQKCAELIISAEHEIKLFISNNPEILQWAKTKGLSCYSSLKNAESVINNLQFDYLFSIVNNTIIPTSILKQPKQLAINYHDAPLPKYAGVNATSWAILNQEKQHGISWHVMTDIVDGGDLLKQVMIPIDPDDTALLLNIKCYEAALTTFAEILLELEQKTLKFTPQNIHQRTFYARNKKPDSLAIIDWSHSAQEIYRLYRALHFGEYKNTLCRIKILIQGKLYVPNRFIPLNESAGGVPGEIININSADITVSTNKNNILLGDLHSLNGEPLSPEKARVGEVLPHLTRNEQENLEAYTLSSSFNLINGADNKNLFEIAQRGVEFFEASPGKIDGDNDSLSRKEYQKTVVDWNQTERSYPRNATVFELFQKQAKNTPNNIAAVFEHNKISYLELDERSNQLARYIRRIYKEHAQQNFVPNILVALYLERSLDMLIAILAVLKAGGAYVPIDPSFPEGRVNYILKDTKTNLLLTQEHLQKTLPDAVKDLETCPHTILLDDQLYIDESSDKLAPYSKSTDLAYVIYTSGTTGDPKGVLTSHRGLVNRLTWMGREYGFNANDKVLQKTPYIFDVSVWELLLPILYGAQIVFPKPDKHKDAVYLHQLISEQGITRLHFVPSMLQAYLNYCQDVVLPQETSVPLLDVFCSGEVLPAKVATQFKAYFPQVKLHNLYGPTEVAIDVSAYNDIQGNEKIIPIGRPIQNIKLYVLDPKLQPLPIDAIGELHIAGVDRLHGYLNKESLTAEKFITNVFASKEDKKQGRINLYKTGDLVRWLPNGNLEYIGRNDFQVKIRGFRIELGEIEAVLSDFPDIKQVVVLVKERKNGAGEVQRYLVAYYISDDNLADNDLVNYLSNKLPDYMIPSGFIRMDTFPISINGKLDRQALPNFEPKAREENYTAPVTRLEAKVCEVWQEALGIQRVGITDDFFRLGGNSILAIQVSHRISSLLDKQIGIVDIFKYKSIQELASFASIARKKITIPVCKKAISPLSFSQERLWFIEQYERGTNAYHIPIILKLRYWENVDILEQSLNYLLNRHQILRTIFETGEKGETYQVIGAAPLKIEKTVGLTYSSFKETLKKDVNQFFDLKKAYPIRVVLYEVTNKEFDISRKPTNAIALEQDDIKIVQYLLINIHHIAFDGWSEDIFLGELDKTYEAFLKGNRPDLATLPIQYKDFAAWQKKYLSEEPLEEQIDYWRNSLQHTEPLNFPTDYPRPAKLVYSGQDLAFKVENTLYAKLKTLAKARGCTLYTVLLSAFYILLYKYTGQNAIAIGSPVANRHYSQLESLIGFFVNNLVISQNLQAGQTGEALINSVHKSVTEARLHQDIPFERLVEVLEIEKDLTRNPIFQIMFSLQTFGCQELNSFEKIELDDVYRVAKFDLSLFFSEEKGTLKGKFNYATSLFKESTIERLIQHYQSILTQLANSQNKKISHYDVVSEDEKALMQIWNNTDKTLPYNQLLHEEFKKMASTYPDKIALISTEKSITYRELNVLSDSIAHQLHSIAPTSQSLIAIRLPKGWKQVVACLGILKSGAAFLPLSMDDPIARVNSILQQAQASMIIVESEKHRAVYEDSSFEGPVLFLDEVVTSNCKPYKANKLVDPADLAYVIFTSGSTGIPKGVMISHQSALNTILEINEKFEVSSDDKVFGLSAFNFDLSIYDIFGPLSVGGSIVLPLSDEVKDPSRWMKYFENYNITIWNSVPALMQLFIDFLDRHNASTITSCLTNLSLIMLSGDWIPLYLPKKITHYASDRAKIISLGGATEASIWSIYYPIKEIKPNWTSIPYGKPLANQKFYILDLALKAKPTGVVGDLYIAGVGLAKGYLNDVKKTKAAFVIHPETKEALYRTGDLGRYLDDGNIEFCGRNDFQIKVRGFRIELAEIERALTQYFEVAKAVILPYGLGSEMVIVGFLILNDEETTVPLHEIRIKLKKLLPEHMIPQYFHIMNAMLLTANGKLDRQQLIAYHEKISKLNSMEQDAADESEMTPTEAMLSDIWSEVLGIDHISKESSFFALGGHSLLVTKLAWSILDRFGVEVSLIELFESSQINEQAILIEHLSQHRKAENSNTNTKSMIEGAL